MKKIAFAALALVAIASSCKKEETTTTTPTTTTPTTTTPTAVTPGTTGNDISGALISINMSYKMSQMGIEVPVNYEIGSAVFYSAPGSSTLVDAGTVSVNSVNLDKAANNSYSKMASTGLTPSTLNFDNGSSWSIGGASSVTSFSYNHTGTFPSYTGTMPTSVTKASGLSFTFSTSNLSGADSVVVFLASGNTSITKTFAATAGTVTLTASDLSGIAAVSDNTGILEVCPYKYVVFNANGKKYVAIKEQAVVKNVNIN